MRAYVLSIGSELIGGHLTDTNATFLAQELAAEVSSCCTSFRWATISTVSHGPWPPLSMRLTW